MNKHFWKNGRLLMKKMTALLLVLTVISGTLPGAVWAAAETDAVEIATAEEFAAMNESGSYRLTADITVTEPCARFGGTFDGDGHTVTLSLNSSDSNVALFGRTNRGAEIRNVTVDADITSQGSGSTYGTAGLVGQIYGSTVIENCGVTGTITNTNTGYSQINMGGLVGYLYDDLTLNKCFSTAELSSANSSSNSAVGGLVGGTGSYTLTATDCYAAGNVTAAGGYAGGLIGKFTSRASFENCYSAGTVSGDGKNYGFAYSTMTSGFTVTNSYYNADNADGFNQDADGLTGKTPDELTVLAGALGASYMEDSGNQNNGYPILDWQYFDPNAVYNVTITVSPADCVLTWDGQQQEIPSDAGFDGTYHFADVAVGQYDYTVSNEAGDYAAQSGTVSVRNKDAEKNITLELNRHSLRFILEPADAELTVKSGETELTAGADGAFSVTNGTYDYEVSAFGYQTASGSAEVDRDDCEQTVSLTAQPADSVTFVCAAHTDEVIGGRLEVRTGDRLMTAREDSDGFVYDLPVGYKYTYVFSCANYAKQKGEIDLTGESAEKSESITIPMAVKTAWEGAGDISEPETDSAGVYQIGSGSELAWLAQEVAERRGIKYSAVLTKDIDLGEEEWTPIGKNYSTRYAGDFDGRGHQISGLFISGSASENYGLFGYVEDGSVRNLTVAGEVDLTGSGSASYGSAGIVGCFAGTTGVIENCVNSVNVKGQQNVGGVVGIISDGYSSNAKAVRSCVNLGSVASLGNKAGGVAGYLKGAATIENCYNRGDVTGGGWYAGGITAYTDSSYCRVANCYSTGAVSGSGAAAVIGRKSSGTLENLYYLDLADGVTDQNAAGKTQAELAALANDLGAGFAAAPAGVNDGYPILIFQVASYDITFTVDAAGAKIVLKDAAGSRRSGTSEAGENSTVWTFRLPDGEYTYTVTAPDKEEASGSLTVNGADLDRAIHMEIRTTPIDPSAAWDGEEREQPAGRGTETAPYEIENGAQLAWFADLVSGTGAAGGTYHAMLTADINLGDAAWTPIGSSTRAFSGSFDGGGHAVFGLSVSDTEYAGLFGVVETAEIKNLIVRGSVNGRTEAAGIAARATGQTTFLNCGNEASVSGQVAAGILANNQRWGAACNVTGCYNTGAVTGTERAAGIVGKNNGDATAANVYNTGAIRSADYAGGILGYSSSSGSVVSGAYNSGRVEGKAADTTGAIAAGKNGTFTDCSYLSGCAGASDSGNAAAVSSKELQRLVPGDSFVHVTGRNYDYPVLAWQGLTPLAGKVTLAPHAEFAVEDQEAADEEEGDQLYSLPLPQLSWQAVSGAERYVITLWQRSLRRAAIDVEDLHQFYSWTDEEISRYLSKAEQEEFKALAEIVYDKETKQVTRPRALYLQNFFRRHPEQLPQSSETATEKVLTIYDVSGTDYDLTDVFAELPEGVYYAAVAPAAETAGDYIAPQADHVEEYVIGYQDPYNRMKPVGGIAWDGTKATWQGRTDFAKGYYTIDVYTVDDSTGSNVYQYYTSVDIDGRYRAADLGNLFAVGHQYAFAVKAMSDVDYFVETGLTDSPESAVSPVYKVSESGIPGDDTDRTDWIAISSAEEWIDLANIEDVPVDPSDAQSESRQAVEWSKKYYLTADLDFSRLPAAYQTKTKSIGNVSNRFMGTMDGNGHVIKGLTLSNNDSGLFSYVGSTGCVYGLKVINANVLFSDNAAVIAHNNFGLISQCGVENCNITADTGAVLGGMVSRNYGIIRESYVQGGKLISNSQTATGHAGFVGANEENALIERCWTSMDVNTVSDYTGGFVGLGYGGTIRDCFALGNVTTRSYSGGFVGRSVFERNHYENCYAAGRITATDGHSHGFIGENKPDSAFQSDQSAGITNCYYLADSPADSAGAAARTLAEMQTARFLQSLDTNGSVWAQAADQNNGLPYLAGVKVPESAPTAEITVKLGVAVYDKETYTFSQLGETQSITMESSGNTGLTEVMDEAVRQQKITYSYDTSPEFGRYISQINGRLVQAPDGWMFTINDTLSNVSASLATVKDGDQILWFEGTTENRFLPPTWEDLKNAELSWVDISSKEDLLALAAERDDTALGKNYRLTCDLDLDGTDFAGIGTAAHPFTGMFDGQRHKISNVKRSGENQVGFFNVIKGATVKNLTLEHVQVAGKTCVGGLVGLAAAELDKADMAQNTANLIGNCHVSGTVDGEQQVGGLVGINGGAYDRDTLFSIASAIDKCDTSAAVSGKYKVGGLVGENQGAITKSAATGGVNPGYDSTADGQAPVGTIVGGFAGDNTGDIYDSRAEGNVTGSGTVGGFVGYSDGAVKNCYSLGNVTGTDTVGGFAGSISKADTVISAGTVSIEGTQTTGYTGGFAGNMGGSLVGVASQITIKNAYGNCTRADGTAMGVIGNSSAHQSDGAKAVLAQMALTSKTAVSDKLYELFGAELPDENGEAAKYRDGLRVSAQLAAGSALSLLKDGEEAAEDVTVTYETEENDYLAGGSTLTLKKQNDSRKTVSVPVTVKLTDGAGNAQQKRVTVILPAADGVRTEIMDNIAATLTESSDSWTVMDMAVYGTLADKTAVTSEGALQNALNLLIADAGKSSANVSDRSRLEIVLRAMGVDTTKLYGVNSNKAIDNAAKLKKADLSSGGYYAAPWILLADMQGNVKLTDAQRAQMIALLKANVGDGMFSYEYAGVTYADPDTAGVALAALARFYDSNADARSVVDQILSALPAMLDEKGSLGNANADAIVITGLLAMGRDPQDYTAATGANLVDGLLSYVNDAGTAFLYANWSTGELEENALATEQSFRALVALAKAETAFNIYDFSKVPVQPGRATAAGVVEKPDPEPSVGSGISVTLTIKADKGVWLKKTTIELKKGATVYHAFTKALAGESDLSAEGAESGYVKSMTKGGTTLAEFDKGANSGWLYNVNGETPNTPMTKYKLEDGDDIVWFYSMDYQTDPNVSRNSSVAATGADAVMKLIDAIGTVTENSGEKIKAARTAYDKLTKAEQAKVTNYKKLTDAEAAYAEIAAAAAGESAFADTKGHWAADAIAFVVREKLFAGTTAATFEPDAAMNRGMLVTVLWHLDGSPGAGTAEQNAETPFVDVPESAYYAEAVAWARANGIVKGYSDTRFAPEEQVTREQIAAILFHYAEYKDYDVSGKADLSKFADSGRVSAYAADCLRWANAKGVVNGRTKTTIAPQGAATRAEVACMMQSFVKNVAAAGSAR